MKRILITMVAVVSAAAAANAASITVTPDAVSYLPGETITLTVLYDSEGEAGTNVKADLRFDPTLVSFQSATVEQAASFGGGLPWTIGNTQGTTQDQIAPVGDETLIALDQLGSTMALTWGDTTGDPQAIVGTYTFLAIGPAGSTNDFFWSFADFFSADETSASVTGASVNIVPEPTTAALLGLGLFGLALGGRRR